MTKKTVWLKLFSLFGPYLIFFFMILNFDSNCGYIYYDFNKNIETYSRYNIIFGPLGVKKLYDAPNSSRDTMGIKNMIPKNYLVLNNLLVKPNSKANGSEYIVQNGEPFLVKNRESHLLPFYLDFGYDQNSGKSGKINVLIPVSDGFVGILIISILVIIAIIAFFSIGAFLSGVFSFVMEIAKGNIFSEQTIWYLKRIMYLGFLLPAFYIVVVLFNWAFVAIKYPDAFDVDTQVLHNCLKFSLIGCFFLALYRAFIKGSRLQQENSLTI